MKAFFVRLKNYWNGASLYHKTFWLALALTLGVVTVGEGVDDALDLLPAYRNLPGTGEQKEIVVWLVTVLVFSIGGSVFLSRIATGPISRLHRAVDRLAKGDLKARIDGADLQRGDEAGILSRRFNDMADTLTGVLESERLLLRDISHELRSPLARLEMALALLDKKVAMNPPETAAEYLGQMEKDVRLMEEMVGRLLERARLESLGRTTETRKGDAPPQSDADLNAAAGQGGYHHFVEKSRLDLSLIARQSIDCFALAGREEGKELLLDAPPEAFFFGSEYLCRGICDNLIKNALRYTAEGTAVEIALNRSPEGWHLVVADRGPGLAAEHLDKIFRPFYQADAARTHGNGFGLGLAIVRQSVDFHGGTVMAENRPCGGLAVTVFLPVPKGGFINQSDAEY